MMVYIIFSKDKKSGYSRVVGSDVYTTIGKAMAAIERRFPNAKKISDMSLEWETDTELIWFDAYGVE